MTHVLTEWWDRNIYPVFIRHENSDSLTHVKFIFMLSQRWELVAVKAVVTETVKNYNHSSAHARTQCSHLKPISSLPNVHKWMAVMFSYTVVKKNNQNEPKQNKAIQTKPSTLGHLLTKEEVYS